MKFAISLCSAFAAMTLIFTSPIALAMPVHASSAEPAYVELSTIKPLSTDDIMAAENLASSHIEKISAALSDQVLKDKLVEYGLSEEEAQQRLSNLTAEEAQTLAAKIDELPKGGSEITILLLVVIIVLLLN